MEKSLKKSVCIPPYWVNIVAGIGLLVLVYLVAFWVTEPGETFAWEDDRSARLVRFAGVYLLIISCFHWSIHKEYIMIHLLWIPIRIIRWEKLSQAEYIYKWSTDGRFGEMTGQGIVITLKGCPCFSPEIDGLNMFLLRHPFRSLFIRFTPRNQQRYVAIFKRYYPELEFQIGYEKNFEKGKPYIEEDIPQQQ